MGNPQSQQGPEIQKLADNKSRLSESAREVNEVAEELYGRFRNPMEGYNGNFIKLANKIFDGKSNQ